MGNDPSAAPRFKRTLNRTDIVALSFGAMIGWGWVVLTGGWVVDAGSLGAILGLGLGGLAIFIVSLLYAELAAAIPVVGGEHEYALRALGPVSSFVCTWALLLGYLSVSAFEAVALPTVVGYLAPALNTGYLWTIAGWDVHALWVFTGVAASLLLSFLNVRGIRPAAFFQGLATLLILLSGIFLVTGATLHGDVANLTPLLPAGIAGILLVLVAAPFMFVGFDVIPQTAGEINLPAKSIGRLLLLSVVMAIAWYCLIILGVALAVPRANLSGFEIATADTAAQLWGSPLAATVMIIAGIGGILTSWNAFIAAGSRAAYAMAASGMLPRYFAKIHPVYNTPYRTIYLIGILSALAPFWGRPALVWLVNAGGLGIVMAYGFVCLSFIALRRNEPTLERPFRAPGGTATGFVGLAISIAFVALYMPWSPSGLAWPYEWAIVIVWSLLGIVFLFSARQTR